MLILKTMEGKKSKPKKVYVITSTDGVEGVYYNKKKADGVAKNLEQDLLFRGELLPRVSVKPFKVE